MTAPNLDLLRKFRDAQRERLALLQREIEARSFDMSTLYRLAEDAAAELERTEALLKRLENGE